MKRDRFEFLFTEQDYLGYFGVIYKITNKINHKLYIGQTINFKERLLDHEEIGFNPNSEAYEYPLYRAIRKYGLKNFSIEIIATGSSFEELDKLEIYYIKVLNTLIDFNQGYNLDKGGKNGLKSEYTKSKMRLSQGGENNPSYNKKGDESFRAVKIIDLQTCKIYGGMITCAEEVFNDKKVMKQLSKVTNLYNNRLSYNGKYFARVDNNNNIYLKLTVAEILKIDINNANGKSYIILSEEEIKKQLSKKA